jgi:hypothetical protein
MPVLEREITVHFYLRGWKLQELYFAPVLLKEVPEQRPGSQKRSGAGWFDYSPAPMSVYVVDERINLLRFK